MKPVANAQLICVSDFPFATYSGMLPGVLAGQYSREQMQIDLVRACSASKTRLILSKYREIDVARRQIIFDDRPALPFDLLSIGIGSVPGFDGVQIDSQRVLPIKPMQTFLPRLDQAIASTLGELAGGDPATPARVTVVGGGAGGVEISMCLPAYLRKAVGSRTISLTLVHGGNRLANGVMPRTQSAIRGVLERRGWKILPETMVTRVKDRWLTLSNGSQLESDIILWATNAIASPQLKQINLPHDERGFLSIRATLESTGSDHVLAVGDSGTIAENPTPKAGVYAVRQGKVLWENIQRFVNHEPLKEYRPQHDFLKLLNTGDGRAIGEWRGRTFNGPWVFRLKDYIDRRFMEKHQQYEPAKMPVAPAAMGTEMRCQGCGGKIGGSTLSNLLQRLNVKQNASVILGLDQPDDAALIKSISGRPLAVTTDFFSAMIDDPYLVGRIAALNATSDIFATAAKPTVALTMASIPDGHPREQEQMLYEVLAGSLHEFNAMDVSLVGGHTIEGDNLTIGFTVIGEQIGERPSKKGDLRVGDEIIMTKPLGVGILLAALMQGKCKHDWYTDLIETMLKNNGAAINALTGVSTTALTDITGFGLAGHLYEMLKASNLSAELDIDKINLLAGVSELVYEGIESTLAPKNRWVEPNIDCPQHLAKLARYAALFDPQTNGGLLVTIQPQDVGKSLKLLHDAGFAAASCVARVVNPLPDGQRFKIIEGEAT